MVLGSLIFGNSHIEGLGLLKVDEGPPLSSFRKCRANDLQEEMVIFCYRGILQCVELPQIEQVGEYLTYSLSLDWEL